MYIVLHIRLSDSAFFNIPVGVNSQFIYTYIVEKVLLGNFKCVEGSMLCLYCLFLVTGDEMCWDYWLFPCITCILQQTSIYTLDMICRNPSTEFCLKTPGLDDPPTTSTTHTHTPIPTTTPTTSPAMPCPRFHGDSHSISAPWIEEDFCEWAMRILPSE